MRIPSCLAIACVALLLGCGGDCDGDGVEDREDDCPLASNPAQADADADGVGAACDPDDADPAVPGP